ncbi:MAG: NUDIX hydrolase [Patescibacteria group bacterium]
MSDPRYQYDKANVIKVILERPDGKVLLIQEPETNEWMPGHWGLPGGKPLVKESLYQAFKRKTKEELGSELEPEGIFRLEELLIEGRTVFMFHAVAKINQEIKLEGESKAYKWVNTEDIQKMDSAEFTEFFNKKLLTDYLMGDKKVISFDLIETQEYYNLSEDADYKRWIESGKKK